MKRILIAYFSRSGENFVGGAKKSLASGNTEKVASLIQQEVGGDLFAIEPAVPYSNQYEECVEQAKAEKLANARPALKKTLDNGMSLTHVIELPVGIEGLNWDKELIAFSF